MITLQNLEDAQTIIMELAKERMQVLQDLVADGMIELAKEESYRTQALCNVIEIIQVHKDYMIDSLNEIGE